MARLVFQKPPAKSKYRRGETFELTGDVIRVGSDKHAELRLESEQISTKHAQLLADEDGLYSVLDQGSGTGTYVDGERLPRLRARVLQDGMMLRFGDVELFYVDVEARHETETKWTFAEWWENSDPAPQTLPPEALDSAADLCGTTGLARGTLKAPVVARWYELYSQSQRRACLPLAPAHLIDLASLIVFRQPPLRPLSGSQVAACASSQRVAFYRQYQQQHLCSLAAHPGMSFIRSRVSQERVSAQARDEIVVRFIVAIANWVTRAWLAHDHGSDHAAMDAVFSRCSTQFKVLTKPRQVQRFLIQLSEVTQNLGRLQSVVPPDDMRGLRDIVAPVERFVLGARTVIPEAFQAMDDVLVSECLKSKLLDERDYKIAPVDIQPLSPRIPSRNPGDRTAIKRIRKTNRIEDMPEVTPSEFVYLGLPDGVRHLTHRLMHEGLQRWERESYDDEIKRERYLACYVVDVGQAALATTGITATGQLLGDIPTAGPESHQHRPIVTPSVHGRRLAFEFLRDIAMFLGSEEISLDIAVFLEPLGMREGKRMVCQTTLDELKSEFNKSQYDDMVELERRIPGFFFGERAAQKVEVDLGQFVRRAFESGRYDLTLFTFLGPERTVRELLPADLPPPRKETGAKDIVQVVQLGTSATSVEVAQGDHFEEVLVHPALETLTDRELRYQNIENLLGITMNEEEDGLDLTLG